MDTNDTHALDMPQQFFAVFPEPDPFPQEPDTLYEQYPWEQLTRDLAMVSAAAL